MIDEHRAFSPAVVGCNTHKLILILTWNEFFVFSLWKKFFLSPIWDVKERIYEIEIDYLTSQRHTLHTDQFSLQTFFFSKTFLRFIINFGFFRCAENTVQRSLIKAYWIIKAWADRVGSNFCGKKSRMFLEVSERIIKQLKLFLVKRKRWTKMSNLFSSSHKWEALVPVPSPVFSFQFFLKYLILFL